MPSVWDRFSDPVEAMPADDWDAISEVAGPRVTRDQLKQQNPAEYDSASPEFKARYGNNGVGAVLGSVADAAHGSVATLGDAALNLGRQAVAAPIAGVAGLVTAPAGFIPGMQGVGARNIERVQNFIGGRPFTERGQMLTDAIAYPFEKLAQGADFVGQKAADATGSPLVGSAVNTALQVAPALAGRGRLGRGSAPSPLLDRPKLGKASPAAEATAQTERPAGLGKVSNEPPSLEDLKSQKDAAYKRAEETGVVFSPNALNRLKVELVNDLKKEGLNRKLHPKAAAALEEIGKSKGKLTLSQMETLRKIANDAKGSIEPADARLGARIVEKIDDFEANLSPDDVVSGTPEAATAFKEARALNTRLSKANQINEMFDRARIKAGANYTQSGLENALRQEFKSLALNKNKMRRFTLEERESIKKVAMGGPMENALRWVGKFAPTGVVSGALAGGLGTMLVGPAGMGLPVLGAGGRYAATRMTLKNASRAESLMRTGPEQAKLLNKKTPVPVE